MILGNTAWRQAMRVRRRAERPRNENDQRASVMQLPTVGRNRLPQIPMLVTI